MYESARPPEVVAMLGIESEKADAEVRPGLGKRSRPEGNVTLMKEKVSPEPLVSHRAIGEIRPQMIKANLPKGESSDYRREIGECLDYARRIVGWTHEQLATELKKDKKQVGRWLRGEESTQLHAVFTVPALRQPFIIAQARLSECFDEDVTLKPRRRA